ncbi:MAG TPA: proteasome ATPase, partial [Nitrospiria bacterium]|nr:proteasome ATPase [Nitrospiria bacterium]
MGESKKNHGRSNLFRDSRNRSSAKKEEAGDDPHLDSRSEEYEREIEKLQIQVRSMEEELRQLHSSRSQLDQAFKQNERLTAALMEAKSQIEILRVEVEKLTAPPSSFGVLADINDDGTASVFISGRKMKVSLSPDIKIDDLKRGQELILNEALNVVEAHGFDKQGEVVRLKDLLG